MRILRLLLLGLVLAFPFLSQPTQAGTKLYEVRMFAYDSLGDLIKGEGPDNSILLESTANTVRLPKDSKTGVPMGPAEALDFTVVKRQDLTSPIFHRVSLAEEGLTKVEIAYYEPGASSPYYVIILEQVIVSRISTGGGGSEANEQVKEAMSFYFGLITWLDIESGNSYQWVRPKAG